MTDAKRLEEAIEYRDRLKDLLTFKRGIEEWEGRIDCHFGGYRVTLTMKTTAVEFRKALEVEEKMLRNTLEMLGVKVEEE